MTYTTFIPTNSSSLTDSSSLSTTINSITESVKEDNYLLASLASSTLTSFLTPANYNKMVYNNKISNSYLESLSDEELSYFCEMLDTKEKELTFNIQEPKEFTKIKTI